MEKEKSNLKHRIGRLLGVTAKSWKNYADVKLAEIGSDLTMDQAVIILHAWHHQGVNQQQISFIIDRDKTSTTRFIDILENKELVERRPDKNDRRQNLIHLTEKGETKCKELRQAALEIEREIIEGIDKADLAVLRKVLGKMQENILKHQ